MRTGELIMSAHCCCRLNVMKKHHRELNYFYAFKGQLGIDTQVRTWK